METMRLGCPETFRLFRGLLTQGKYDEPIQPNARIHAAIHVVVENQVALGDEIPIRGELARLMREGLDRHEAIHAIGTVLAGMMFNMLQGDSSEDFGEPNEKLFDEVRELTAEKWLAMGEEEDD